MDRNARQVTALAAVALGAAALARARRQPREGYTFDGKSVLITGGSRGLGLVMARRLAAEGAQLTIAARNEAALERAAADIRSRHPGAAVLPVLCDVSLRDDVERAVAQCVERYGTIDVLVNNAGVIQVGPVAHMKMADYDEAMRTHFWGPLYMIDAALPHMRRAGGGRIVNISSIGGKIAVPHLAPYSASKFALTGLSDALRAELAREQIVVTTVCPGLMRTGSPPNALFKGQRPEEYAWFAIASSVPVLTIDARRAARQIIEACRRGEADLTITPQARLAALVRHIAPELFAGVAALVNRLLPDPASADGDRAEPGRENESAWAAPRARLTALTYRAAERNNEI